MGVTSGGLDFEDTVVDGQEEDIESSSTKIEDVNVALASGLLVETVSSGCRSKSQATCMVIGSVNIKNRCGNANLTWPRAWQQVAMGGRAELGNEQTGKGGPGGRSGGWVALIR